MLSALLDTISEAIANVLSPVNTIATNVMQCLDQGPRIIYNELDLETKTQKPVERTTPPPTENLETLQRVSLSIQKVTGRYKPINIQVIYKLFHIIETKKSLYLVVLVKTWEFFSDSCERDGVSLTESNSLSLSFATLPVAYEKCRRGMTSKYKFYTSKSIKEKV